MMSNQLLNHESQTRFHAAKRTSATPKCSCTVKNALLLTVSLATAATLGKGLGPGHYAQNGLVTQLDGEYNVNRTAHDPTSAVWRDLVGSGTVTFADATRFHGNYVDNGYSSFSMSGATTISSIPASVEVAVDLVEIAGDGVTTRWPFILQGSYLSFHGVGNTSRQFRFFVNGADPRPNSNNIYTNTLAGTTAGDGYYRVYSGGNQNNSTQSSATGKSFNYWAFNNNGGGKIHTRFFAFRAYNRQLSGTEVRDNYYFDSARFWGHIVRGTGGTTNWSEIAWKCPYGDGDKPAPTVDYTNYARLVNVAASVASTDTVKLRLLSLEDGATLALGADSVVEAKRLFVEDVELPHGTYTGEGGTGGTVVSWITGTGVVRVAGGFDNAIPTKTKEPDANGYYVFGDPDNYAYSQGTRPSDGAGYQNFSGAMENLEEYALPPGAKIKLVGGLIVNPILGGGRYSEVDVSELKYLVVNGDRVFKDSAAFTVPSAATLRFQNGTWTQEAGKYWLTSRPATQMAIYGDLVINGTMATAGDNQHLQCPIFYGNISGNGTLYVSSFSNDHGYEGDDFLFEGLMNVGSNGCAFRIRPRNVSANGISELRLHDVDATWGINGAYCADGLLFGPKQGEPGCELKIKTLTTGASDRTDGKGVRYRSGGVVVVWGGSTIHAEKVTGSLHVVGSSGDQNCRNFLFNGGAEAFGVGNFIADELNAGVAQLFLSTNINARIGKVNGTTCFNYTYQTGAINHRTLDFTDTAAGGSVFASQLGMLPVRISGFKGTVNINGTESAPYTVNLNITNGTNCIYNDCGCIGSGTLAEAPATGTIDVRYSVNPGDHAVKGKYSVARFTSGGEKLDGWTVTLNGSSEYTQPVDGKMTATLVRDSTGIWLNVRQAGLGIVVR